MSPDKVLATPHVFGLTRELAHGRMSWISSLFHYDPPQIGFSRSEQKLLSAALRGGTDEELSGDGMTLLGSSTAVFRGPTITGNAGNGVHLEDGSFAGFVAASITGNLSGTDVDCAPQFPITRFVERTGGITNCVEPVSNAKLKAVE
jgi:hypothetical protein